MTSAKPTAFKSGKVTIVGPGTVGMVLAYTLLLKKGAREIILIGRNEEKAEGEANDMMHAQAFLQVPVTVKYGGVEDAIDSEIVVVCASKPMPEGETDRNALAVLNADLMMELLPPIAKVAPNSKILMVTNPVDPMTMLAKQLTGFPRERVMGTGTLVDSIRFRELLSQEMDIHPEDIRAYILGEHGEFQFPAMSVAQAGGEQIENTEHRRNLCERAKMSGVNVFRKKGNTCYAIGQAAAHVVEAMTLDQRRTLPLSVEMDGYLGVSNTFLSLPVVVGKNGIERFLKPKLNSSEAEAFRRAAASVDNVFRLMSNHLT